MLLQLNPEISVMTPKGEGFAFLVFDYGLHLNTVWAVSLCDTGEIIHVSSEELRRMGNEMYAMPDPKPFGRCVK